jgi:hypothetical protein
MRGLGIWRGKKEDDEGIQFYLLPMAKKRRGGRNLIGTEAPVVCSKEND